MKTLYYGDNLDILREHIPDPIPVLGFLDALILLPLGVLLLLKILPAEVMADCRAKAAAATGGKKPTNRIAGEVVSLWRLGWF